MKVLPSRIEAELEHGLPEWYIENTPGELWTKEAFDLFQAARKRRYIGYDFAHDCWHRGRGIPKAGLAYFCKRASSYLRLTNGCHAYWKPFEWMFNYGRNPLRKSLFNLEGEGASDKLEKWKTDIDLFFNTLNDNSDEY